MLLEELLEQFGLTHKEITIFLGLAKLGMKPASTVAAHIGMERSYVYKSLKSLAARQLVYETRHDGITHFHIPDATVLTRLLQQQEEKVNHRKQQLNEVRLEFDQLTQKRYVSLPKISFYDTQEGLKNCYLDIFATAQQNNYLVITFFASNTFESVSRGQTMKHYMQELIKQCQKAHITIDSYLGNGMLLMESIAKESSLENLLQLPAGNAAVNIFLLGRFVYFIVFATVPIALKIENEEIASAMHFLFSKLEVE